MMSDYPHEWVSEAQLEDGTRVQIRPILPEDAPRLQEGFKMLTPESIYMRFLESFRELSDEQARYFANVDYDSRMAFVGTIMQDGEERVVGVARYDLVGDPSCMAESAVIVADPYQGMGLGTILMIRLIDYARANGVTCFLGTIHNANTRIMSFIKKGGYPYERVMVEPGVWEVRVDISNQPQSQRADLIQG